MGKHQIRERLNYLLHFCGIKITMLDANQTIADKVREADERAKGYCVVLQKEKKKDKQR